MPTTPLLVGLVGILLAAASSTQAADVSFAGFLLDRSDWRDPLAGKFEPQTNMQLDADGDEVLGTHGYLLFGPGGQDNGKLPADADWREVITGELPPWITSVELLQPAHLGRFPGYASVSHPTDASLSFTTGALIFESGKGKVPILKLTIGEGAPNAFRLGLMVDNINESIYNAHAIFLEANGKEVGPIVTLAQTGSANGIPDYYFFDVSRAARGDVVTISAEPGAAGSIILGALTIDTATEKNYSEFEHPGYYLKDFFIYKAGKTYHLYYNIGLADAKQEWQQPGNEEMFGHATSEDLKSWAYHDPILITRPLTWEEATVSAPSIVKRGDTYYMAYTGFNRDGNQRMGMATSKDLLKWERDPGNPLAIEPAWSSWKPTGWADFRDPHLLEMPDGYTYLFNTVHVDNVGGSVAISRSKDLVHWEDLGRDRAIFPGFHPAESAHAFTHKGKVYAFIGGGGHALMVTDDLMSGDWKKLPFKFPRGGLWSGFEVVEGPGGQMLVCAFLWKMHGNFIRFWEVDWDGDLPVLRQ